ncbi:MAG: hypothetical protein RLZZ528_1240 [Pseudomonadota bacterium]
MVRTAAASPHLVRAQDRPGLLRRIALAVAARRQRLALARLDGRLLDDAGIDRDSARAEASRPLWDVPVTWLR